MEDLVYSRDEEVFYDYDHIMDELRDEYEPESKVKIYQGTAIRFEHSDFVSGVHIIENFMERGYDEGGEWAECYLSDVGKDKAKELEKVIIDWLNDNAKKPRFYRIKNVKEITVTVD